MTRMSFVYTAQEGRQFGPDALAGIGHPSRFQVTIDGQQVDADVVSVKVSDDQRQLEIEVDVPPADQPASDGRARMVVDAPGRHTRAGWGLTGGKPSKRPG